MKGVGVRMSQGSAWSGQHDPFDPERARIREEIRRQALHDATKATDAVRAMLRVNLTRGANARIQETSSAERQRSKDSVVKTAT